MKDFKTSINMQGEMEDVWASFTNPFTIEIWSGYPAKFEAKENTMFEIFDGDISGLNLKFEENKLIQQEWFFGDVENPSIVTIKFFEQKKNIRVSVEHTNIPSEAYDNIVEGWNEYMLKPIKDLVEIED